VDNISLGLELENGVAKVTGDVAARTIRVAYDGEKTTNERLSKAIKEIGYEAIPQV